MVLRFAESSPDRKPFTMKPAPTGFATGNSAMKADMNMKAKPSFNILLRVVLRVVRHPSGIAVRAYRSGARNASDGSPQPDASKQFQQEWCKALPVACAMSGERTCRSVRNRRISRKQKACRRVVHMQSPGAALARPLSGGSPSIRAGGRTAKSPRHRIGRRVFARRAGATGTGPARLPSVLSRRMPRRYAASASSPHRERAQSSGSATSRPSSREAHIRKRFREREAGGG